MWMTDQEYRTSMCRGGGGGGGGYSSPPDSLLQPYSRLLPGHTHTRIACHSKSQKRCFHTIGIKKVTTKLLRINLILISKLELGDIFYEA